VGDLVVNVNGHEGEPFLFVLFLDLDHPVLIGFDVGAMVATENHREKFAVFERIQGVLLIVHAYQIKIGQTVPQFESHERSSRSVLNFEI
jgi:hypothetical protein